MSRLALYLLGPPRIERDGAAVQIRRRKAVALLAYLAVAGPGPVGASHSREKLATLLWPESDQSRALAGLRAALAALNDALGKGWLAVDREMVGLNPDVGPSTVPSLPLRYAQGFDSGLRCERNTFAWAGPSTGAWAGSTGISGQVFWLDVHEFRSRLAACRTHDHPPEEVCPACLSSLAEAAALYGDDFLAGFTLPDSSAFDEWQFFQAEGLRQELASALERLVCGHIAQGYALSGERTRSPAEGAYEPAVPYARRWLALDPLHEPAHRYLMRLYAGSGQRAAALRQYVECERVLQEELGASPEEETVQLYHAIQEKRELPLPAAPPLARAVPATAQVPARRHNLPVQLTPFVGREALLAAIADRLRDPTCRLLTLVGPGGSGKTRLALEAAAAQLDNYAHGVYFVSLAPLDAPEAIVPAVATALGFSFYTEAAGGAPERSQQRSSPRQQLLGYLGQKSMLLVMDNLEHLLSPTCGGDEGGAGLVIEMLQAAPGVKVLATSRARLNVQGEHLFHVPGMDVPYWEGAQDAARYSAVQLFLQSAHRALPGFELTDDNLASVVEICRLVDGLPLGILLAAAWVGMLTPAEIAAEIHESLDFLETDLRDLPERQRSMRAVFDHSWNLLSDREQAVLQALSVFRGGFTRQAGERVTGATLHELKTLVDKSLLQRGPGGRYDLHELLRQYAAEKLTWSPAVRPADGNHPPGRGMGADFCTTVHDRHSATYVAALQQWGVDLRGPRQRAALAEIEADGENARVAWNWAVEQGQVERLDRAMEGLCRSYEWRGRYQEGEAACRMAAEKLRATASDQGLRVRARALAWQGVFSRLLGRTEPARQLLEQSLALLEGSGLTEKAFALLQMGYVLQGDNREQARQCFEQSLALYRALGDLWGTASALNALGGVTRLLGAYGQAKQLSEESLAIRRALGDHSGVADSLLELGWSEVLQGQFAEGERLIQESLAIRQEIGGRARIAEGLLRLGVTLFWLGRFAEAHSLLEESVVAHSDLGERHDLAWSKILLGLTEAHLGSYASARVQAEMGLDLYRNIGERAGGGHALLVLGHVALAMEAYAEAQQRLQECVAMYREVGVQDELGWALADLAVAARGLGDLCQARRHLGEALRMSTAIQGQLPLTFALPATALFLADQDQVERAVELYALALHCFPVAHSRWFEDVFGQHIAAAAGALPLAVVAAAQERGGAGDLEARVQELLVEQEGLQQVGETRPTNGSGRRSGTS